MAATPSARASSFTESFTESFVEPFTDRTEWSVRSGRATLRRSVATVSSSSGERVIGTPW